jgi:spore maturation protein CgeB
MGGKPLKILIGCSTLDLKYKLGCTPSWWQLFKALYETGNEVIVTPYLGDPVESLWWRTYPNPCSRESKIYNWYLDRKQKKGTLPEHNAKTDSLINRFAEKHVHAKWEKHLLNILNKEKDADAVFFMNIPLNHIRGIATSIKKEFSIPVGYFDGDMPTILPKYAVNRGFKFNYYVNADISEYDAFFSNSKGVIPDLKELGAQNIHPLYYAADPDLFKPITIQKNIDVSFFGYGSQFRDEWMKKMITLPSLAMKNAKFSVAGGGFSLDLGNANLMGDLSFSEYRQFTCRSKICLNITRWSHTSVYASSTARPFELAAFGACMVSQPYEGIGEWFDIGREMVVVNNENEVLLMYQSLLDNIDERQKMGECARERILKSHTYRHRAEEILQALSIRKTGTDESDEYFRKTEIIME